MSAGSIQVHLRINFPVILFTVLLLHLFLLPLQKIPLKKTTVEAPQKRPLNIREIRTVGSKESKVKDSAYLVNNDSSSKEIKPASQPQKSLSLSDLNMSKSQVRPGTRPDLPSEKKAINAVSLKGNQEMRRFIRGESVAKLGGPAMASSFPNSDVMVNLEVPEGVHPDELNKFELMFYGFQRRTAINYVNSFYKQLDKFNRENPHLSFPLTDTKQVMTGRLTYDEKGNIKQIKMIRWSNVDRLQDFFLDVLKEMDTLHNPPKALWESTGEFSIFFSLVVNG